jgi:dihydrofolate reductase
MKKLKLQIQVSIDGYIAGPNGEMDWMTWGHSENVLAHIMELTGSIDTILLGRKLATGFIPHWEAVVGNPRDPSHAFGKLMTETPRVVFTTTMTSSPWANTTLATGDLKEEINRLKQQPGKDLIVYGGAGLVSSLISGDLIDEYHLFVNPAAIGRGMPIFEQLAGPRQFTLVKSFSSDSGIVVSVYQPKKGS